MNQQQYWDSVAESKTFTTPFQTSLFCSYVQRDAVVLDVGCGYGRTLQQLHQQGFTRLIGVDFSVAMIQRGKGMYPHLDFRWMQNGRLDFPSGSVDAVLLLAVLTCIRRDAEQQALLSEIERVLKPGGVLYVNDFLLNNDARNRQRYEEGEARFGTYGVFELPEGAICRHHRRAWMVTLLQPFERIVEEEITFTTMNGHASRGFFFLGRKQSPEGKPSTDGMPVSGEQGR